MRLADPLFARALSRWMLALALPAAAGGCGLVCSWGGSSASTPAVTAGAQGPQRAEGQPGAQEPRGDDVRLTGKRSLRVNVFGEVAGIRPAAGSSLQENSLRQHTFTNEGYDANVSVDPTGKYLLFSSTRDSEHAGIYLQRVDGTAVTQLTNDSTDNAYPVFSPDGKLIAFSSTRSGTWQIYVMEADGRNVIQVTSGQAQSIHPSFSPDGKRLVYCSLGARNGQWELWIADLATGEKHSIGNGLFPVWSPDRSADRIAFQRARQRGSRWFSLWTIDVVNGEGRRATEVVASTNAAIVSPAWSPDGKRLAFATVGRATASAAQHVAGKANGAATPKRAQTDIWTIDSDGINRQRLTDGRGVNLGPFWSADNRIFFISDRGGAECIWSIQAEDPPSSVARVPAKGQAEKQPVPADVSPAVPAAPDAPETADVNETQH